MFRARYYGSGLGRFMTPDWAAKPTAVPYASYGKPQSLNLYSYVYNNPTAKADPDGHCSAGSEDNPKLQKPCGKSSGPDRSRHQGGYKQLGKRKQRENRRRQKGGSHETGGSTWTKNGKEVVAPAVPGKFKDVRTMGVAEIDPTKAADPSKQKPADVKAGVAWHVHPKAEVIETKSPTPEPSPVDIGNAGMANLNVVVGARNSTVYVFGSSGVICQEGLSDFNKEPK